MGKAIKTIFICVFLAVAIALIFPLVNLCQGWHNSSRLLAAIERENQPEVAVLLEQGADPNRCDVTPGWFWTLLEVTPRQPLSVACFSGNLDIVKTLLEYGASANAIKGTGISPLQETLLYYKSDDVEIIELLLENGALIEDDDVFAAAKMVPQAFDPTMENGSVFAGVYDEDTAIGITTIVFRLLGERSVNSSDKLGKTLLIYGVQSGNTNLVRALLQTGADVSAVDLQGKTALDYVVEQNNEAIFKLLVKQ